MRPRALRLLARRVRLRFRSRLRLFGSSRWSFRDRRFGRGLGAGLVFTVMLVVYAIAMPSIGFLAASVLFMVAVFLVYRPASWLIALILTLAVPVLVDQVLRKLFLIPLPSGGWF